MKLCMGCMEQIEDNITTCPHCGYDETTLRQESYYLDPGTVVGGKYIVGRVISYGGYTITYLGMDAETNRKVMVKEYLPSDFSTRSEGESEVTIYSGDALEQFEQGLTTFLNEANRIQQLGSVQGIARVYDCVAENDTGYVISEYLEGQTLQEILDSGRTFTPQETKEFISQILAGLSQVHPLDIIHCDIAPETIMVTNTGEIKLLDFGATRYVTTANSKSLAIILKQGYAPEEQYRSKGVRGPWTDVYAVAAVMYRMITGKVPLESVERALVDELQEPSKMGLSIPQNMENAMMNALNVYQKDRSPSAEVFLRELNSEQVKRIQVKKQKDGTGKFPKWAKGLVACLLCVVIGVGGKLVYDAATAGSEKMSDNQKQAEDIVGKTEKEAETKLEKKGLKLQVNKVEFDNTITKEEITEQDPPGGVVVTDGVVKCTLQTNKKCDYSDIWDGKQSAMALADLLGVKQADCTKATKGTGKDEPDNQKHIYGEVYGLQIGDTFVSLEDIEKKSEGKANEFITISDIKKVYYYVSPFLYRKMERSFEGENISKVAFDKYNDDMKPIAGATGQPPHRAVYYSLSTSYSKGYIVKQNYKTGEEYDAREDQEPVFDTVKEVLDWSGKKAAEYKTILENKGFEAEIQGDGENQPIVDVKVIGGAGVQKNGQVFKKDANTKIIITTQKPTPKPTVAPTAVPTPKPTKIPSTGDSQNFTIK